MDYEKEFNVTAIQVAKELKKIQIQKKEYDDYGKPRHATIKK